MESIIAVIVATMLMIFTGLTLYDSTLRAQEELAASWQAMELRLDEQTRTAIETLNTTTTSGGRFVEVTLRNSGTTRLTNPEDWDVVFHYEASSGLVADWYPYTDQSPNNNEWSIIGIYVDADAGDPEAIEPGIVNPGEELILRLEVAPKIKTNTTNQIVITTDKGAQTSAPVIR